MVRKHPHAGKVGAQRLTCAKKPCGSCPYRKDVSSGLWSAHEYDKLPKYDGEIVKQLMADAIGRFDCHQRNGKLCAGWVATHGANNLLALRLQAADVLPSVWDYESPVPVFASGKEAAEHGQREINNPGPQARRMIAGLFRKMKGW